jgi:enamine deaminase RidA (YjgF/YER057c/UK114 family)
MDKLTQFFEIYPKDRRGTVPLGFCVDGVVYAGGLTGADRVNGAVAPDLVAQTAAALGFMRDAVEGAGGSLDNVARAVAFVGRPEDRDPVYGPWDAMFPNKDDRPAFKVLVAQLPRGVKVRIDALAILGQRRTRIDLPGVPARDPTVVVGEWMFTSRVHGTHSSGTVSKDVETETTQAFDNIAALAKLAGGGPGDIVQLTAFGKDAAYIPGARAAFERAFADAKTRPAFETLISPIPPHLTVMLEAIAKRGARATFQEIVLDPQTDPAPVGVRLGGTLIAPWLSGAGLDTVSASSAALGTMDAFLKRAGVTRGEVARVTAFLTDVNERPNLNVAWEKWFPEMVDRPPHKYVKAPLDQGSAGAIQLIAVPGGTRRTLEIPGLQHQDPMSMGARTGNIVASSRIFAMNPKTHAMAKDAQETAIMMFDNAATLLDQAGLDWKHVTQATSFIGDAGHAPVVEAEWRKRVGPGGRARLHFIETNLGGNGLPRVEILALG